MSEPVEGLVEVRVADRAALRAYAGSADVLSSAVAVVLESASSALSLVPRPEWPALTSLRSRRAGGGFRIVASFARPVPVAAVVAELGRQAVWPDRVGNRGLVVRSDSEHVHVDELPALSGPASIGPLDERVLNPIGFRTDWERGLVELPDGEPTQALVAALRDAQGVSVGSGAEARTVAGLAMAGVPLSASSLPDATVALLGAPVAAALTAPVDLGDPLAREEHSLVLRRAALDTFSSWGWARAVGDRIGVPVAGHPSVSIVLATRRPEQLEFALAQVARQRGVESLQLVLAPHGFDADEERARRAVGDGIDVRVVRPAADAIFGDVLDAAARAADGDVVLKMDDDDWYAPDVVADLLRARAYSGAELVGMPAEFHYLAPRDVTVKRGHPSELYTRFVAGGTMMVDRSVLREVGGFRSVHKYVDAQLLAAVTAAGGAIYRTHGLGYLLRRNESGHTWQVDMDYLLDPSRVERTWEGLTPSRLMGL